MFDFDPSRVCPICKKSYCSEANSVCPDCKRIKIPERYKMCGTAEIISDRDSCIIYSAEEYVLKVLYGNRYKEGLLEANALHQLRGNENIVILLNADYEPNVVYLLEDSYLTLSEYIRLNPINVKDVYRIAQDICSALIYCHDKGYYHLDVHPRNIYIDNSGRARLGDFGNAQRKDKATVSDLTRVTHRYVFPEYYAKDCAVITEQWDLYGLCMVLYGLLNSGILPEACSWEDFAAGNYSVTAPAEDELSILVTQCIMNQRCKTLHEFRKELEAIDLTAGAAYERTLHFPYIYLENIEKENYSRREYVRRIYEANEEYHRLLEASCASTAFESPLFNGGDEIFDADSVAYSAALGDTVPNDMPNGIFDTDANAHTAQLFDWVELDQHEEKSISISDVCFSAVYNKEAERDTCISIDVIMYEPDFRSAVELALKNMEDGQEKQSGVLRTVLGTTVTVELTSPDINIDDNTIDMPWHGKYLNFSFLVDVPEDYARKQIRFTASIFFDGIPATRLKFAVNCKKEKGENLQLLREDIKSAFVSYASQDRQRVAGLIQGMQAVRRDLNLFFDVENLRAGEQWEKRIYSEIDKKDFLFLCWSNNAAKSNWVDTEWRYALKTKGENGIMPMPLELPDRCPPPDELKSLSFNNRWLYFINSHTDDNVD